MQVAKVLDTYRVAINRGAAQGITHGAVLHIAEDIIDPETGGVLGTAPDLLVRVTDVHERYCVAETFNTARFGNHLQHVNIGDHVSQVTHP